MVQSSLPLSHPIRLCLILALTFLMTTSTLGDDWPQFRGPGGSGRGVAVNLPNRWDSQTNVVWKTDLPGQGSSSPTILNGRIYLTCYSGYAQSRKGPGDMNQLKRHVLCLDQDSGKIIWNKEFTPKLPESKYSGSNNTRHGYATSTIATDGEKLYVFFGLSGVYALDLNGTTIWHQDVGTKTHGWGSGASPLLYKDKVIINASVESETLFALDTKIGKILWKKEGIKRSWSTPALVQVGDKQELVLNIPRKLTGFDPDTGDELWHCTGIDDGYLCPSVITEGDTVYAIGARKNMAMAVRAGGRGDVTDTHILWTIKRGSNVTSPVFLDGHLYWTHESRGQVYCVDAKTGKVVFEESLDPKPGLIYASMTAADGKLFIPSQEKGVYIVSARPSFLQMGINQFKDDPSRTNASMAVSKNRLYHRTDQAIYCLGY